MRKYLEEHYKFIVGILLLVLIWNLFAYNVIIGNNSSRDEAILLEASRSENHLGRELGLVFADIDSIETFVHTVGMYNITDDDFQQFVEYKSFNEIGFLSFSIAPDGVIGFYHSDVLDNDLVGHNLFTDDRAQVRDAIEYTIETGKIAINGPFELLVNRTGLVFRKAIFEDDEFVGIINYVVDFDEFYQHLFEFDTDNMMTGVYDTNNHMVFGESEYSNNMVLYSKVALDYVDWYIGMQPSQEYSDRVYQNNGLIGFSFTISQIVVIFLWSFYYFRGKSLMKKQDELIYYDGLSNLPNRLLFEKETKELIYNRVPFYLGFGDLDNFKNINDVLGHSVGDQYLSYLSSHMKMLVNDHLRVYRWGGDEFVFIFTDTSKEELHEIMDHIFHIFKQPFEVKETKHQISISIGVVEYPTHGTNIDDLVKRADIVMYDIKSQQKNTYSFFEQQYLDELLNQMDFQQTIDGFTVEDFDVYLQPVVDTKTNQVRGFEGLSRLFDENGKQFPTHEIIKLYEQDGTITKLDKYVFRRICEYKKVCIDRRSEHYFFTFNISPLSLTEDYIDYIERVVHSYGVEPSDIVIEIIETLGFKDVKISIDLLERIKRIGFKIAMDDFGMGYSSLSYITKLPLDIIKIDRSFIHDYESNSFNRAILHTIKDISNSLNLEILVEGIEQESQLDYIKNLGAQYYQGYYHSRPMSFKNIQSMMNRLENENK